MLIGEYNLKVLKKIVNSRREIFKYDDVEEQKKFKELTSKNTLSRCFDDNRSILKESKQWLKELKLSCKEAKRCSTENEVKTKVETTAW